MPRPAWSVLGEVEDDLFGLDLAVVDHVQPGAGCGCPRAERAACHRQREQEQRVVVVPVLASTFTLPGTTG